MSDPNLTPPPPDGPPSWTPPPAPPAQPLPPAPPAPTGHLPSPPLPGQMSTPPAPPAPPAPPLGGPPSAPPPPGQWSTPTAHGAPTPPPPGYGPQGQQPYAQQPYAQPYTAQGFVEGYLPEIGRTLGSKGKRIGAKAIDLVVVIVVQLIISGIIGVALFASSERVTRTGEFGTGSSIAAGLVITFVVLLFDFAYNVVCTAQFGGTPGKLALGLRVVSQDGPPADLSIAFRRWSPSFALIVVGAVPILGIIAGFGRFGLLIANLVMILVDERRRDVFDHAGRTYVVDKQ